jgi:hypothetical protein
MEQGFEVEAGGYGGAEAPPWVDARAFFVKRAPGYVIPGRAMDDQRSDRRRGLASAIADGCERAPIVS